MSRTKKVAIISIDSGSHFGPFVPIGRLSTLADVFLNDTSNNSHVMGDLCRAYCCQLTFTICQRANSLK